MAYPRLSLIRADYHYCKHCDKDFRVKIAPDETGDFFLVCPYCNWKHYRRIENGVAVHADFSKRVKEPIDI